VVLSVRRKFNEFQCFQNVGDAVTARERKFSQDEIEGFDEEPRLYPNYNGMKIAFLVHLLEG
jgi:hypothetical protein